jgi:hypothetical protein
MSTSVNPRLADFVDVCLLKQHLFTLSKLNGVALLYMTAVIARKQTHQACHGLDCVCPLAHIVSYMTCGAMLRVSPAHSIKAGSTTLAYAQPSQDTVG